MTSSQASMHAAQAMHSYCRPLRMSMPVGHTCTHSVQSMQSPRPCARAWVPRRRAPRGSPRRFVVGDDQGVLVEHRALETRVGTHVLAHLLAQESGIAVGRERRTTRPRISPTGPAKTEDFRPPSARIGREVADESEAGIEPRAISHSSCLLPLRSSFSERPRTPDRASCAASGCPRSTARSR